MGKRELQQKIKSRIYTALSKVNDRAFSLITLFSVSACTTVMNLAFSISSKFNSLLFIFSALAVLVVCTILSSSCKAARHLRIISAAICVFLWLFVAQLSGILSTGSWVHSAAFYAVLFWSNINLLGVFLNARK